jgi:hypothetical protein
MRTRAVKLASLVFICLIGLGYLPLTSPIAASPGKVEQERRTKRAPQSKNDKPAAVDYSTFSHNTAQHKQACSSCHKFPTANWNKVRTGDAAFPDVTDYPQHPSCIECHRQQFFAGAQPVICTVCHTNPSPRDSSRHPFPNPIEIFNPSKNGRNAVSEFGISFPHDKHVDLVGEYKTNVTPDRFIPILFEQEKSTKPEPSKAEEGDPKSCAVCHKTYQPQGESDQEYVTEPPKNLGDDAFWLKKGAFKTNPTHATCFTCHGQDGVPPAATDCATCHKLLPAAQRTQLAAAHDDFDPKLADAMAINDKLTLEKWSRRDTARFRHEWAPHSALSCTSCHNITTLDTLDKKTRARVKSCGGEGTGCHIEATTDGILNLEVDKKKNAAAFVCTKCHVRNGKSPAPEDHIEALRPAKAK